MMSDPRTSWEGVAAALPSVRAKYHLTDLRLDAVRRGVYRPIAVINPTITGPGHGLFTTAELKLIDDAAAEFARLVASKGWSRDPQFRSNPTAFLLGPAFRVIRGLWRRNRDVLAGQVVARLLQSRNRLEKRMLVGSLVV